MELASIIFFTLFFTQLSNKLIDPKILLFADKRGLLKESFKSERPAQ